MDRIFGINAVSDRLKQSAGEKNLQGALLIRDGKLNHRLGEIVDLARKLGLSVRRLSNAELDDMTQANHQGVGLEVPLPSTHREDFLAVLLESDKPSKLILILDGVTDTRNFGACLRSAASMAVDAVVVPKDNSAPLNDLAVKTASGGASAVPVVQVVNLARAMDEMKQAGVWIVGTHLQGTQSIASIDCTGHIAVVMGSEDKGMRQKTAKACDYLAQIPMPNPQFGYNVSVATGICLYEVVRQRGG